MNCADCGKEVVLHKRGRWAVELVQETTKGDHGAYSFCCRTVIVGTNLIRADYHYVAGEVQRHWPEADSGTM